MKLDLNADLGELPGAAGAALDAQMLGVVSSASVACGFHAGDAVSMRRLGLAAREHGVRIGAHLSYDDREHFGRRDLDVAPALLRAQMLEQLRALEAAAPVAYVKPHGALYHRACRDAAVAEVLIGAIEDFGRALPVVALPDSLLLRRAAAAGLPAIREGFADRGYEADGGLIPRGMPGALLVERAAMLEQALRLLRAGRIDTLCLHGDTPDAPALARALRAGLEQAGVVIGAFA